MESHQLHDPLLLGEGDGAIDRGVIAREVVDGVFELVPALDGQRRGLREGCLELAVVGGVSPAWTPLSAKKAHGQFRVRGGGPTPGVHSNTADCGGPTATAVVLGLE